jgi:preprotein translocase subunit SecG
LILYLNIAQILVSMGLITLTVLQGKEAGLGRMFGGDSSIHVTRRGAEKTIYQVTIVLACVFFVISLLSVILQS